MRSKLAALCTGLWFVACAAPVPVNDTESDAEAWERLYASGSRWSEGNSDASALYFREALLKARAAFPAQDPRLVRSELALGEALRRQGKVDEAEPLLVAARDGARGVSPPQPALLADVLESLGLLRVMQGELLEAEAAFIECAQLRLEHLDPAAPETAEGIVQLAEVQRHLGKHDLAEANLLEAAAIYGEHGNRYALRVATIQNNLGLLYQETGRFVIAERQHRQAMTVARQLGGENSPNAAIYARGLADLYVRQNKLSDARTLYQGALAVFKRTLGPDHIETRMTEARLKQVDSLADSGGAP